MARLAAAGPSPLHHHQRLPTRPTPTVVPAPNPSFPRRREPHLPQQTPSTDPPHLTVVPAKAGTPSNQSTPTSPAPNPRHSCAHPRVIPAKAGIQRGAERGNPTKTHRRGTPKRQPPVVGAFREWPVPPQRDPHPSITASTCRPARPHRHTGESRYPEGRRAGQPHQNLPPWNPQTPTQCVGAFREWPVPPQRDPHPTITASAYRPTQPHRRSRFRGNPGQGRGEVASPSPAVSATPHRHSCALFSRHSCEGRNPEVQCAPVRPEPVEGPPAHVLYANPGTPPERAPP